MEYEEVEVHHSPRSQFLKVHVIFMLIVYNTIFNTESLINASFSNRCLIFPLNLYVKKIRREKKKQCQTSKGGLRFLLQEVMCRKSYNPGDMR